MPQIKKSPAVRVRFAPSPTGFLHIGGVRTALFAWLYARHFGGKFLLRIEDTDTQRSEDRYTQDILACLKWLGLNWDEDLIYQSTRTAVYLKKAEELVAKGHAYRCYCTEAQVEAMREKAQAAGKKPMYDRTCRNGPQASRADAPYVIRAKIPLEGTVEFLDLIHGATSVANTEIDDFVLVRSNGAPTYNFTVVVDDVDMGMTHVIRGDDHLNNTPKQIHLYRFFDFPVPEFAHLSMILGQDKKKLSKRHGDVSANYYRGEGYLPEAMLNFLVRLGWSHGDQEIFSMAEMIEHFDFSHVQKSSAVFNLEKLQWINGHHIRETAPARLSGIVVDDYSTYFQTSALARVQTPLGEKLISLIQPKVKLVKELAEQLVPLCTPGAIEVDATVLKWNKDSNMKIAVKAAVLEAHQHFSKLIAACKTPLDRQAADAPWGTQASLAQAGLESVGIDQYLRQLATSRGVKLGDLAEPMRLCVTGRLQSAGLFELLAFLPWDQVEPRLAHVQNI